LEAFNLKNANEIFDNWVASRRSMLQSRYIELLRILSIRYMSYNDHKNAVIYLECLLTEDIEDLAVYGLLMVCYAVLDQISLVEKIYQHYVDVMATSFDMLPDDLMKELREVIRQGQLSNYQAKDLISKTSQEDQNTIDPQLKNAFLNILKATGVTKSPTKSSAYIRVLHQAQEEAVSHGINIVGTPHLFLALCAEDDPYRHQIQSRMKINFDEIVQAIHYVLNQDSKSSLVLTHPLDHTLEMKNTLKMARDEADQGGATSIDLPHLWLALLMTTPGLLVQIFERYGFNREDLLEIVKQTIV
jgi:hypothetical protein